MKSPEFNRLRDKLSYQGGALKRRIEKQIEETGKARRQERDLKKLYLRARVEVISAEDELSLLYEIAAAERASNKEG